MNHKKRGDDLIFFTNLMFEENQKRMEDAEPICRALTHSRPTPTSTTSSPWRYITNNLLITR